MRFDKTVFIITYGRSGSTLLQGILNSIPGYEIKGENSAALVPLFRSYKRSLVTRYHHGHKPTNSTNPWYGAERVDPEGYAKSLATLFVNHFIKPSFNCRVIGFKEIRFGGHEFSDKKELKEYMDFMRLGFPECRFIFNKRNMKDVSNSGWWKNREDSEVIIKDIIERMEGMYSDHADVSYWVDYDEYIKDVSCLHGMFSFLDEEFDSRKVKSVISEKHSY